VLPSVRVAESVERLAGRGVGLEQVRELDRNIDNSRPALELDRDLDHVAGALAQALPHAFGDP
jgi:hypothetical protein